MKSQSSQRQSILFTEFCRGLHFERASDLLDFENAFQIIHASYAQRGFILPNRAGIWMNRHHLLANSRVFLVRKAKQLRATLTLVEDGPLGLPMETLFRKEVRQCREENGLVAEATCLARALPESSGGPKIVNHLMGVVAQAARRSKINQILITVHPRHAEYYIRLAGFRPLGPSLPYNAVRGHLAMPLALHLPSLEKVCPEAHRRYFGMQFNETTLAAHPTPQSTLLKLAALWRSLQSQRLTETLPDTGGIRSAA